MGPIANGEGGGRWRLLIDDIALIYQFVPSFTIIVLGKALEYVGMPVSISGIFITSLALVRSDESGRVQDNESGMVQDNACAVTTPENGTPALSLVIGSSSHKGNR